MNRTIVAPPLSTIQSYVEDSVRDLLKLSAGQPLSDRTSLLELGAQSLDFVELVARLDDAYGVTLPEDLTFPDDHTLGDYANAVFELQRSATAALSHLVH